MATTIDKYVLETSVTGMKDVDALNTSVTTLGKSIDAVTSKKISMTINATGFDDLNTKIGNINTSLSTLATKTVKPSVSLAGIDQLNASIRGLSGIIGQVNSNLVNIQVNDSEVLRAKQDVSLLNSEIDKTNNKSVSIKADNGPTSLLGRNIDELKSSFDSLSTGLLAGGVAAAIAGIVSLGTNAVKTAGDVTDLAEASGLSQSEIYSLGDSIINAGGAAGQNYDIINKLSMSIEDAATNGGKAAEAFKALNVPIKDSNGKMRDTGDILRDVIEELGKTTDRTKKLSTAQELLGKANRNLKFEDIEFTDDATMNTQISNTDSLGAAFDKLMQAVNKFSMAGVSSGADDAAGKVGTLTQYINNLESIFNFATQKSDTFGVSLVDLAIKAAAAVNPITAMVDLWEKGKNAVKYLRENVWQNKSDPLMAGNPAEIKSNPLGQSKGYQGRIKPFDVSPPAYDDSRFGVKPPKGGANSAADAAAREAEARKKAREESDAQLKSMQLLQRESQISVAKQVLAIGQNKIESEKTLAINENIKTLNIDAAKVEAEITREKNKGKDADQHILANLEKQKIAIFNNSQQYIFLAKAKEDALKREFEEQKKVNNMMKVADEFGKLKESSSKVPAIQAEIDAFDLLNERYKANAEQLKEVGAEYGNLSTTYLALSAEFQTQHDVYMDKMLAQKALIVELQAAEKARSESFAGGWEDAMKRMVDSFTPAQQGAKAFNDLWGNISSSIDTAVTTGKFKFADFRDSVIRDIAAMMAKAAASKIIGTLLGTAVSAVIPGANAGSGLNSSAGSGLGLKMPRAKGGSVGAGNPYLVGERGPELFMPGQNGTIIPNRNLEDTKPQVITNNYYNVSAVDGQSVARFFMENKNMVAAANRQATKERS